MAKCFFFFIMAFLLLYDTELFWHKYLCFQYLSCLDFTACMCFVKQSCFGVGNPWTLVCKCYLNLCFMIVRGMCVQTLGYFCLLSRSPALRIPRRAAPPFIIRRQGGHGFALDSILILEDIKERGLVSFFLSFFTRKMVLCQEGPFFFLLPYFLSPL